MTLKDLLGLWRKRTVDLAKPFEWTDADGVMFANAAEREACERALLLPANDPDSDITAFDAAAATGTYDVDERLFRINRCTWNGLFMAPTDRDSLDGARSGTNTRIYGSYFHVSDFNNNRDWSTLTGAPRYFLFENRTLTLVRIPTVAAPVRLGGYRFPLSPMALTEPDRGPEISDRYHLHLVDWMEFLSFDNIDADYGDPERASAKADAFTKNFGPRLPADQQRKRHERRRNQVRMNPNW